jgi:hypothetical protein
MPPYTWLAQQNTLFIIGIGLLLTIVVILARASRVWGFTTQKSSDDELAKDVHVFPGEVSETRRPVPWLIWLVFVGYFVWAAGYVIWNGIFGYP